MLLVLFAVVVEGVHLWLARVELENAMEAAALAAVKEWAAWPSGPDSGWTHAARIVGQQYAAANTILRTDLLQVVRGVSVADYVSYVTSIVVWGYSCLRNTNTVSEISSFSSSGWSISYQKS